MKDHKGITLITLIITIIVLIILAAIFINASFKETLDNASFTRKVSEMTEVYDAVVQRGIEHRIDSTMYPYVPENDLSANPIEVNGIVYGKGYYLIKEDSDKSALGLERVTGNYIVSYETGEVISEIAIQYENRNYYKLSDVSGAVQSGSTTASGGEYDDVAGVNKPILNDGMIPVKQSGNNWVVTTEDASDWYDYANGKYATIMLMDELTLENKSNDEIRKMSRAELKDLAGEKVIIQGSTFIWIPRYSYKQENREIKIIYSHLTNDYLSEGYIKSPAFYFGGYTGENEIVDNKSSGYVSGGRELTGIWISKYEAGYNQ